MNQKLKILLMALLAVTTAGCSNTEKDGLALEAAAETGTASVQADATETVIAVESQTKELPVQQEATAEKEIVMTHIHGVGITRDGSTLYVPAHDGLKVFHQGAWSEAPGEQHDYMGFSMVNDGFYSSGHPGEDSNLANPFGVIRSVDMGESLILLDLYEEVDFHLMAAGYNSRTLYVVNPQPNSRMEEAGVYYSTDDAKTWNKSNAEGLKGQLSTVKVHPDDEAVVAIGTDRGVFMSHDYGQKFTAVTEKPVTAMTLSPHGKLLVASQVEVSEVTVIDLTSKQSAMLNLPELSDEDEINHVTVNPKNEGNIIISTIKNDIYLTEDYGTAWVKIADKGTALQIPIKLLKNK